MAFPPAPPDGAGTELNPTAAAVTQRNTQGSPHTYSPLPAHSAPLRGACSTHGVTHAPANTRLHTHSHGLEHTPTTEISPSTHSPLVGTHSMANSPQPVSGTHRAQWVTLTRPHAGRARRPPSMGRDWSSRLILHPCTPHRSQHPPRRWPHTRSHSPTPSGHLHTGPFHPSPSPGPPALPPRPSEGGT